jgi:hypothetical protein
LLINDIVKVREDIDSSGVAALVKYLRITAISPKTNLQLSTHDMSVQKMVSITAAACALSMGLYVDHVCRKCEAQLRHGLPKYKDLGALVQYAHDHPRLLSVPAANLASRIIREHH